jgi:hypothetical protein
MASPSVASASASPPSPSPAVTSVPFHHIHSPEHVHAHEEQLSVDEKARLLFAEYDRSQSGEISVKDLALIFHARTTADHGTLGLYSLEEDLQVQQLLVRLGWCVSVYCMTMANANGNENGHGNNNCF